MPIYDYLCADCGLVFEELARRDERPACPTCGGQQNERQFSPPRSELSDPTTVEQSPAAMEIPDAAVPEVAPPTAATVELQEPTDKVEREHAPHNVDVSDSQERQLPAAIALAPRERTMRRDGPELWDLERDFERRQAVQLSEIAEKSQRLVKMMERIEALEGLTDEVAQRDRELENMRQSARALEQRTRTFDHMIVAAEELRSQVARADQHALQRGAEIEALKQRVAQEQAQLMQQIEDREARLTQAHELQGTLRADLQKRDRSVEDAQHACNSVEAELESRTAALFKRDEMIQQSDATIAELREDLRQSDRRATIAEEEHGTLSAEIEAMDAKVRLRDAVVKELDERAERLDDQLESMRAELTHAEAENQKLNEAWTSATREVKHLQRTQSVLADLKPMLESLETTLSSEIREPQAALPSEPSEILETTNE